MTAEGESELHWQTEVHANPEILEKELDPDNGVKKSERVGNWNDYYFQSWFSFGNNNGRRMMLDKQGYSTGIKDDFFKPVTAENVACTIHFHYPSKKKAETKDSRRLAEMDMENMCEG